MRQNTLVGAEAWLPFSQAPTSTLFHMHTPSSAFYPLQHAGTQSQGLSLSSHPSPNCTHLCCGHGVSWEEHLPQQPEEGSQGRAPD